MKYKSLILLGLFIGYSNYTLTQNNTAHAQEIITHDNSRGLWQDKTNRPIKFKEIQEYNLGEVEFDDLIIGSVRYLQTDSDGNLYFFDSQQSKLISLNESGELRWHTGESGRGPGDFQRTQGMKLKNDRIFISNISSTRIDEFDLNGNFIKSRGLNSELQFSDINNVTNSNSFLFSNFIIQKYGAKIAVVQFNNQNPKIEASFEIQESVPEKLEKSQGQGKVSVHNNEIIYTHSYGYKMSYYNFKGDKIREVTREYEHPPFSMIHTSTEFIGINTLGFVHEPYFFQDGYYLVYSRTAVNVDEDFIDNAKVGKKTAKPIFEYALDLYNKDHELLYIIKDKDFILELGEPIHIDKDGHLYTIDELTVTKYKIQIEG